MHHYVQKDHRRAMHPECQAPFQSYKDVVKRLLAYHIFQTKVDSEAELEAGEFGTGDGFTCSLVCACFLLLGNVMYDQLAHGLLERKEDMFAKYQHLLVQESMVSISGHLFFPICHWFIVL
jgi:hypothetical protein